MSPMVGTPAPGAGPFGQQVSVSPFCIIYEAPRLWISIATIKTCKECTQPYAERTEATNAQGYIQNQLIPLSRCLFVFLG